ncbi:methyltransferase domain-containing protein [Stakelama marina]|uniref:methyltransferase domain-containing protein n=1 Tax=Stakelama marina TaxID=2826939 RepID=UPI0024C383F1|nr:methyltransferase domain-containing protein [Stakelama marina]
MTAPEIFDRQARRLRRDRAARNFADHDFVHRFMAEGVMERLGAVKRQFLDVLDLGCWDADLQPPPGARIVRCDPGKGFAIAANGVRADEDRLPFADGAFDLVLSVGTLDQVNDLPGALTLIRRSLRPDGLFLGAFLGAGSLATLKSAFMAAERERPVARFHPQIDVRSAGDLLMRAGFALPVADTETLNVRYGDIFGIFRDLRGMAATNLLVDRTALRRDSLAAAAGAFADRADDDGRVPERFEIIYLTGWAPDDSQPKPARRGSGTTSLAEALKPPTR